MCVEITENLPLGDSCGNEGGLGVDAFYAKFSDIATWPLPGTGTFEAIVTLSDDFVMKPGKYFRKFASDLEMPGYASESAGSPSNLSANNRLTLKQAGLNKVLIGFLESHRNTPMVFIFVYPDGVMRVLGRRGIPARIESFRDNSGVKTADEKAVEFTVYAPGNLAYFYEGEIPVAPENILIDEGGEAITDEIPDYIIY